MIFKRSGGGHYMHVHICVWSHGGGSEEMGGERQKEEMGDGRGVGGEEGDKGSIKICYDHLQQSQFFQQSTLQCNFPVLHFNSILQTGLFLPC